MQCPISGRLTILFTESSRNFGGQERRLLSEACLVTPCNPAGLFDSGRAVKRLLGYFNTVLKEKKAAAQFGPCNKVEDDN
ncbi:MAG: hypothetical protein ACYDFU_08310 [Nitrospirota bacterium]